MEGYICVGKFFLIKGKSREYYEAIFIHSNLKKQKPR